MSDQQYFWKAKSGHFAGVRRENVFYNASGEHVGIFQGDILYSTKTGSAIAKIIYDEYLIAHSAGGRIGVYKYARTMRSPIANRFPLAVAGQDPDLTEGD